MEKVNDMRIEQVFEHLQPTRILTLSYEIDILFTSKIALRLTIGRRSRGPPVALIESHGSRNHSVIGLLGNGQAQPTPFSSRKRICAHVHVSATLEELEHLDPVKPSTSLV
jgi:hypothetical protein